MPSRWRKCGLRWGGRLRAAPPSPRAQGLRGSQGRLEYWCPARSRGSFVQRIPADRFQGEWGGDGGRLAIHSRSQAMRSSGLVSHHQISADVGSRQEDGLRRRMTTSPCGSTAKRVPGAAAAGTLSVPWESASITSGMADWIISRLIGNSWTRFGGVEGFGSWPAISSLAAFTAPVDIGQTTGRRPVWK